MTKQQESMLKNYERSNVRTLDEVYNSYSALKCKAYHQCELRCIIMNGYDARIPTHNQNVLLMHLGTSRTIKSGCIMKQP